MGIGVGCCAIPATVPKVSPNSASGAIERLRGEAAGVAQIAEEPVSRSENEAQESGRRVRKSDWGFIIPHSIR